MNARMRKKHGKDRKIKRIEVFNLDISIAKFILPRVRKLKDLTFSHPVNISSEEWICILDKIIWSFDYHLRTRGSISSLDSNEEYKERYEEGLSLFAKYFPHLWI